MVGSESPEREPLECVSSEPTSQRGEDRGARAPGRRGRRATTPPPPGSDPAPYDPPTEVRPESENDARLRDDKPPHWG